MGVRKQQVQEHKRELDHVVTEWMKTIGIPEPYYIHISDLKDGVYISKRSRWFYDARKGEFVLEITTSKLCEDLITNHLKGWCSPEKKLKLEWAHYKTLAEEYILSCRSLYRQIEQEVEESLLVIRDEESSLLITDNFTRFIYQNAFYRTMKIYGFEEMKYQIREDGDNAELWLGNTVLASGTRDEMVVLNNIHHALMASFGLYADDVKRILEKKRVLDDLRIRLVSYMDEFLRKKRLKGRCNYIG
ncbi:MAG: hypothetical protein SCAL_000904 [Candidatus Syntrophoarchaeum caldarius]|uniref:Uncharacterized protein n=1 Tax=Candidatus Syntropharchaeum caldarium TaxID=1838285 RepID=A0A1F2PB47_9EURY|nr:MAG: hypothetical protein SCAL_000904 [Candidatus Syntrophoarchaeum caldarius]